jgi:hypothetical protein
MLKKADFETMGLFMAHLNNLAQLGDSRHTPKTWLIALFRGYTPAKSVNEDLRHFFSICNPAQRCELSALVHDIYRYKCLLTFHV